MKKNFIENYKIFDIFLPTIINIYENFDLLKYNINYLQI